MKLQVTHLSQSSRPKLYGEFNQRFLHHHSCSRCMQPRALKYFFSVRQYGMVWAIFWANVFFLQVTTSFLARRSCMHAFVAAERRKDTLAMSLHSVCSSAFTSKLENFCSAVSSKTAHNTLSALCLEIPANISQLKTVTIASQATVQVGVTVGSGDTHHKHHNHTMPVKYSHIYRLWKALSLMPTEAYQVGVYSVGLYSHSRNKCCRYWWTHWPDVRKVKPGIEV